jgi:diacylglycerol O-acyltransferase / wax synthase
MFYERLSALDASFVAIEDVNTHMHVAAALIFEAGSLRTPDGGLDMERIRAYIGSRLHLVQRYRQRLAYTPFERHPVWIDDNRFNLFYHVRHTSLPRPGSERQLKRLCGRILSQKLDLTKPLWEIWVIEGLSDNRFALVAKVHHCMVDGVSGIDLLTLLLSPSESATIQLTPPWEPRRAPNGIELFAGELRRRADIPFAILRTMSRSLADPGATWESLREKVDAFAEFFGQAAVSAPEMPINPPHIGPHRRFDWVRLDLNQVKEVKNHLGGTVNDVVLTAVAGAMRRYLAGRGLAPSPLDFRVLIPVNIRSQDQKGALGNRVAQMVASLPLGEDQPRRIHQRVVETTQAIKHSHQVEATEMIEEFSDWTATAVLTQLVRFAARRRPYNLVVTNVPGPPVPLFLLGARLLHSYPMVPLFSNQALGIALFSYTDGLYFGVDADWDALPDVHDFVEAIERGFQDLHAAATAARASRRPARTARSAASRRAAAAAMHDQAQ